MDDPVAAVAESIVDYVRREDLDGLIGNLNMSVSEWRQELRYEFDLEKMMEAVFRSDILVPKLIMCDIQTISPFHYAALRGVDAIIERFILQYDIPVDMSVRSGSTAIHFASFSGMLDTVSLLVDRFHADVNRRDRYGWTALHYASTEGNLAVVEYLVQRGADISARDKDGTTAAFRAQAFGHVNIVSYFIQSSGDEDLLLVEDSVPGEQGETIYAVIDASKKKLSGTTSSGSTSTACSDYEIAVNPTVYSGSGAGRQGKEDVAHLIRDQLNDVLGGNPDPYMNPVSKRTESGGPVEGAKVNLDIGVNTLTRILKDEFLRFKTDHEISKVEDSKPAQSSDAKIYSSLSDYEDISKFSKSGSVRSYNIPDDVLQSLGTDDSYGSNGGPPKADPPPLPPRSNSFVEELVPKEQQPKKSGNKAGKGKKKSFDRVNYLTLRLEDLEKKNPAKTKALIILNRFDHSNTVMEACFQALVQNVGDAENWKELAGALPLRNRPDAVKRCIRNIETRNPGDMKKQALSALQDWRYYFGESANVDALMAAMKKCGLDDKVPVVESAALDFTA